MAMNPDESEEKMNFLNTSGGANNFSDIEGDIVTSKSKKPAAPPKQQTTINMNFEASGKSSASTSGEGQTSQYQPDVTSTLDEPVSVTIMRDLKAVGYKFGHVFFPKKSTVLLRDWVCYLSLFVIKIIATPGFLNYTRAILSAHALNQFGEKRTTLALYKVTFNKFNQYMKSL